MKRSRFIVLALLPLLFACVPAKLEITLPEIPASPAIDALLLRRQSFSTLKALASVESVRSGRRRSYESVGIIVDGQRRLRAEAFGPLGRSLITLLWNGSGLLLRRDDQSVVALPVQAGLERIFGMAIDAPELCAVLTANLPASVHPEAGRAYQEPDGSVLLEWIDGEVRHRVFVVPSGSGAKQGVRIRAIELYRAGKLVYRAWYDQTEEISHYLMPKTVKIENPGRKFSLTILYSDMDVNRPLSDDVFQLGAPGGP